MTMKSKAIAIVIPCFRVRRHILQVLRQIGDECDRIYVVDDACPEETGKYVEANCTDHRVVVLRHEYNQGVGGAVITGYLRALQDGANVIVKLDGDGQMNPRLLPHFVTPILSGKADYTKGNRFYDLSNIKRMPITRIFGNAVLSFMSKLSTGYWNIFDPTNGYTAIHSKVILHLPLDKISQRYFFETDILFRLNTVRAVVQDIPMDAEYGDEVSNLRISNIIGEFFYKHVRNFCKRIFYNYFLRDFSIASLELISGTVLTLFGLIFGTYHWILSAQQGVAATTGTVMLAALPFLLGMQYLLAFLSFDTNAIPRDVLHSKLPELGSR